jgi:hypothetical protein
MSDTKFDQAVLQILRLTHEDKLTWISKRPPDFWLQNTDEVYAVYFETHYQGRKLALYQKRSRTNDYTKSLAHIIDQPIRDWASSLNLSLLGGNDEILFDFPKSTQVSDLFQVVRYKEANIDEFVDTLLNSKSTGEK